MSQLCLVSGNILKANLTLAGILLLFLMPIWMLMCVLAGQFCFLKRTALIALLLTVPILTGGAQASDNSNLWPVHRDTVAGFRISYPPDWRLAPIKGSNVRFSVVPPQAPGNCNVLVNAKQELGSMDQSSLNEAIKGLGNSATDWANYMGIEPARIRVISSRRVSFGPIIAINGVLETDLENLQGRFTRKQTIVLFLHRGALWSLNCGASDGSPAIARSRYDKLYKTFGKIIGSFSLTADEVKSF